MAARTWKATLRLCFVLAASGACEHAWASARQADFDGDGRADLAIGVQLEEVGAVSAAGGVAVIYGKNSNGLNSSGDQFWTADSPGVNGIVNEDEFGAALAVGDFDNDGFTDLAIGIPNDSESGQSGSGAVTVLYGSSSGLRSAADQLWTRESNGVIGSAAEDALFGTSLSAGDFDGDGRDDLAIGVPGQEVNGAVGAGEVHVLYGSSGGLSASGDQVFNQETAGMSDIAEAGDSFGQALSSGDYDGDGRDDLAIGVPNENLLAVGDGGAAHALYGSSSGLRTNDEQFFSEGVVGGTASALEHFGSALASGDFNGNGKDDLAIGVPGEDVAGVGQAGAVYVLSGSTSGLKTSGVQVWSQDSPSVKDSCETDDGFGAALAVGDFDDDGRDDLAIGVPLEDSAGFSNCGTVNVLYGSSGGLSAGSDQLWHQDSTGLASARAAADQFGASLTSGDYDNDGRDDLAIGVPGETIGGEDGCGAVNVLYGQSGNGLNASGDQFWHQDVNGINDACDAGDGLGRSLQ